MCMLGELTQSTLTTEPVIGYRGWYVKDIKNNSKQLFPMNQKTNVAFNKKITEAILCSEKDDEHFLKHECGLYSYNNYNYYYNNYYYNYYNNYYYNYYNYNYYYVAGKIEHSGKIAHHKEGYRSTHGRPILLVKLTLKKELDNNFQKFLEHFNATVDRIAEYYGCETINHEDFK